MTDNKAKAPIGIFDSGYGGLTILKEVKHLLPDYDYLYLGDNARTPYGTRSFEVVYEYTLEAVKYLFQQGCELVILACNTASAKALRSIQQLNLPAIAPNKRVLGVIRPTAEIVPSVSKTGQIGVFATTGTVRSESYSLEIAKLCPDFKIHQVACPMWVPIVENNQINTMGADFFIEQNVASLLNKNSAIDTIILGCTHYPLLKTRIQAFLPDTIKLLAQGELVADRLQDYLKRHPEMETRCSKQGSRRYLTTETSDIFEERAELFLQESIKAETVHF